MYQSSYKSDSAYFNGAPIFTDWAQCADYPGVAGNIGYVPRLIGAGFFAVQHTGTQWEVMAGQCIANQTDPVNLGAAPNTSPRATDLVTIPGNMISDASAWEFTFPSSTGANTGNDSFDFIFAGSVLFNTSIAPNSGGTVSIRLARRGAMVDRYMIMKTTAIAVDTNISIKFANDVLIRSSIIAATIGNTQKVRYMGISRVN